MPNSGCTYCHALTYIFKEWLVYQAQHKFPDIMNVAYTRPNYNPYSKTYNPEWSNHPNFSSSQYGPEQPRQKFSYQFAAQTHHPISNWLTNTIFSPLTNSNKIIQIKKITDLERALKTLSKTQASMMNNYNQAINRLEVQISQLASSLNERQKGTLSSQPFPNLKNSFLVNEAEVVTLKQCNTIHILRFGKQVDNQVSNAPMSNPLLLHNLFQMTHFHH